MKPKRDYHDLPRAELLRRAEEVIQGNPKSQPEIHFKFTCDHCGERCTLSDANTLYECGECHVCGKETEIKQGGFMVQFMLGLK